MELVHQISEILKKQIYENLTLSFFFVFIFSSLLTAFVFEPITDKIKDLFKAKPKLILNVTEIDKLRFEAQLENFKLLFGTQDGQATLVAAQTGDAKLNKLYGAVAPPSDLIPCEGCTEYSFSLKNVGKALAKDITIDLLSLSYLEIIEPERDPKISNINCGGVGNNKGCRVIINLLGVGETVLFTGIVNGPGIRSVDCKIGENSKQCLKNFRYYYTQKVTSGMTFKLDNRMINFPEINNSNEFIQYHYVPASNSWTRDVIDK